MNSSWSLDTLCAALGGMFLARPAPTRAAALTVRGAAIDTRVLRPGEIFFAFRGDNVDGHAFVPVAFDKGASVVVIDRPAALDPLWLTSAASTHAIITVPDTAAALMQAAAVYRKSLTSTTVIAVGGSNGKTTTTRLIEQLLSPSLRGTASPKSFNNSIGVPLTVLNARPDDQYLLCEIGTNAPGEIAPLARLLRPDIAVITSIGREHLELLGSLEGVAREEAALLDHLAPRAAAIINADASFLSLAAHRAVNARPDMKLITFGRAADATARIASIQTTTRGLSLTLANNTQLHVSLLGEHNAYNALAAILVARRLSISDADIALRLQTVRGPDMRMQLQQFPLAEGAITVINDAYNANPDSLAAGLHAFAAFTAAAPGRRRVAILGDMLELGSASTPMHAEVADLIISMNAIDALICVGPHMHTVAESVRSRLPHLTVYTAPIADPAHSRTIAALIEPADLVYLKGSRGMHLESILTALTARAQPTQPAPIITPARSNLVHTVP